LDRRAGGNEHRCASRRDETPSDRPSQASRRSSRTSTGRNIAMLWTILIILAIVALVLFILSRVRGRGV
jgi:hypothetical protein